MSARQFPENGMKQLLRRPENARELLEIAGSPLLDRLAFERMTVDETSYVSADFRHVVSDLVLTVPMLGPGGKPSRRRLTLSILIEHQSDPDRLIVLRVLDYVAQIWKAQVRQWGEGKGSLASARLRPVLPVVLYTGTHRWERLGDLLDLMDLDKDARSALASLTPNFRPLFVNLPEIAPAELMTEGRYFGHILRLFQERKAGTATFKPLVEAIVAALQQMSENQRLRWLELLSYLDAFVYHARRPAEYEHLEGVIGGTLRTDQHREEFDMAKLTMAILHERKSRKLMAEMVLDLIRLRFGEVPASIADAVKSSSDPDKFEQWRLQVLAAKTLNDLQFA